MSEDDEPQTDRPDCEACARAVRRVVLLREGWRMRPVLAWVIPVEEDERDV